jgi:hypothetical protein
MLRQLGLTSRPLSLPSIVRAFWGWFKTSTLRARTTKRSCMLAWAWVVISSGPTSKHFDVDMPGHYEKPARIGFKCQEGHCGLPESDRAPRRANRAVNFLLRGGVQLPRICGMEDESYFVALIRMYDRALTFVSKLPPAERATYLKRLDKLRSRGRHVGWGVEDNLNDLWYPADLDSRQSE